MPGMNDHYGPEWGRPTNGELDPAPGVRLLNGADGGWTPAPPGPPKISYWRIAWRHKLLLSLCLLAGALGGTAYVILRTPMYAASSTVELEIGRASCRERV